MVQVRHLLLGLASGSALYSGMASALGLGDITLHSALNQPLEAEIELLEVGDLTDTDMKVRLASDAVYARSGVDRIYFLNDLRFTPLLRGGKSVIRVVSSKPVREPYLNFIVELARPNGQLYREYTVLLDPPNASAYNPVGAVPAPAVSTTRTAKAAAPASKPRQAPVARLGKHYQVSNGDSLWTIANRLRAQGSTASQQQLMDDIFTLNPQAFAGNDIGRLQAGANLLLPDGVATVPAKAATPEAEVPSRLTVDEDEAPATPSQPLDPQAEMIAQLQRRLDTELAQSADENTKLQQSVAELQLQVQKLVEQAEAKDRQLAELKTELLVKTPVPADTTATAPSATTPLDETAHTTQPPVEDRTWYEAVWAALGLLLLGLLGLLFWRRQRQEPAPPPAEPEVPTAAEIHAYENFELDDIVEPAAAAVAPAVVTAPREPVAVIAPEPRPASPTDTLEGANIYIAYGRFSEAAGSLRRALDAEPQRTDIRFRLLEVLAQLGDARGFAREEEILLDAGYGDAPINQLKARHPNLFDSTPADSLDDAVLVLDEPFATPAQPAAEDDQFNLDDFSLDPDWDLISPFSAGARSKAEAAQKASENAEREAEFHAELDKKGDVRGFTGSAMVVEETQDEGWFGEGLDDDAYLSKPEVETLEVEELEAEFMGDLDNLDAPKDNLAKFNQALAYIEQGHVEDACDILNELIAEGDEQQRREASELLAKIA